MKRMEELIHLNKKINFEGKVNGAPLYADIFVLLQSPPTPPAGGLTQLVFCACRSFL